MKTTILSHLEELRKGIFRCLIYVFTASLIMLFFADDIIRFLKMPSANLIESFLILRPAEPVSIYIKTALFTGITFVCPLIFWEIFKFIKPAAPTGIVSVLRYVLSAVLLFAAGILFVYFIALPKAVGFLISLSMGLTGASAQISLGAYISFVLAMLACGGVIFQIPLAAFALTKLGILTPKFLSSKRKEAYFFLSIFAAVITPTTDIFNMALFVVPMIVLYEIGILLSKAVYKSQLKKLGGEIYAQENS
jgi:sec-independent protein translocase protein TatC